jgi:hypothetical protein
MKTDPRYLASLQSHFLIQCTQYTIQLTTASESVGNNLLELLHMLDTRRTYHSMMFEVPLCSAYSVFIVPTGTLRLPWLRFSRVFSSVVRQIPGYNSQIRGTARSLPNQFDNSGFESQKAFQPKLLIVLFYILFVGKYVLNYCHRVSTQLQLTNIYHIIYKTADSARWMQRPPVLWSRVRLDCFILKCKGQTVKHTVTSVSFVRDYPVVHYSEFSL